MLRDSASKHTRYPESIVKLRSGYAATTTNEMEDQRNDRNDQKKVDKGTCYVKRDETQNPSQQQYYEQN
jgi:hypothetical protein